MDSVGTACAGSLAECKESAVIRQHYTILRQTIGNDIEYFAGDFYQKRFISREKRRVATRDCNPDMLLDGVIDHLEFLRDKGEQFREFLHTFSAEGAYSDLASVLEKSYIDKAKCGPGKMLETNKHEDLPVASSCTHTDSSTASATDYYDILLIGRTGMGKSTIGNKLLGINPETYMLYKEDDIIKQWGCDSVGFENYFETAHGGNSVTSKCKILSNGNIRVTDTREFADSGRTKQYGVLGGNLQTFRWILQAQRKNNLRFTWVLYFYPQRGPPQRADGTFQEELRVMYGYFGQKIFDIMVVIVTNPHRRAYQNIGFDDEDISYTQSIFVHGFCYVVHGQHKETVKCPPVVYLPYNEDHREVLKMITSATVLSEGPLSFSTEFPQDLAMLYTPGSFSTPQ